MGILKKLAILRREVLLHNHRDEVLRWPTVIKKIEDVYVQEYAIADKNDKLPAHFKSWDM